MWTMGGGGQWTAGVLCAVLVCVLADSWTAYQEQPCCRPVSHHRVRHHRDDDEGVFGGAFEDGHWIWDDSTGALMFVSDLPPEIVENIQIQTKAPTGTIEFRDDIDLIEQIRYRRRYQRKILPGEADIITLQDVKDLALYTAPINILSPMLINLLHTPTTERFLRALILFCGYYLQIADEMAVRNMELQSKVRTPECRRIENVYRDNLADLRVMVAKEYCIMLLGGADTKKFHHMGPQKKRRSLSDKDARLFETLLRMSVQIVWLALGRISFNRIELEINRIFKSEIFNNVEHTLKTRYIAQMVPEEQAVLLGPCVRRDKKLNTRSPLMNEVFCDRPMDFRLTGLGIVKYSTTSTRLKYLRLIIAAAEENLLTSDVTLGIIGMQRKEFDTMLRPIVKADPTIKSKASVLSQSQQSYVSKSSVKKTKKILYPPIVLPEKDSSDLAREVVSDEKTERHDHIREFSCGSLFYRTLYLNEERNTLYVGAMDRVFRLNMTDVSQSHCERDAMLLEASNVARCVSKGKSEPFECRNHIRVLQPLGDGERLYVCGTNAHSPKDWVVYLNLTHLPRHEYVPGVGLGVAKCPYDPADNSTAVWVTDGNPGSLPTLYAGTNAEFTKADPVIFRNDLYDFRTGQKKYNFKRTLKYDSKWLDKTNFVGSFDVGEYVLFFFRETAVEFMNCGKAVYSRVARVCKHDTGGKHILSQNWATYLKARLNCSIPGEFPFYFDEIQSVYQMPGDTTRFYAAFTTGASDGLVGSAICTYSMDDIQEAFAGRFKEQATSSSAWLPVLRARVPVPRPGTCVNNTEALPDNVLNFIRSHPLMDSAVRHEGDAPAFYKRDLVLTTIVVDRQFVDMLGDDITYTVFYAGTSAGEVYKIVQWAGGGGGGSRVADVWRAAGDEPVRALAISRRLHALYLATDNRIRQLPLRACAHRYDSCVRCVLDPYCGWDKEVGACRPYSPGLLHDATNSTPSICEASAPLKTVRAGYGQSVHLAAYGKTPEALKDQHVIWYHHSREKGRYKISYNWERVLQTSERGLVLLSVTESDRGRYECYFGPTLIASYNLDIDIHRCTQPSKSQEYKQVYSDWCHEFEKYKSAMKAWESRQMQCSKSLNASSQQNSMSNEIVASLR